MYVPEWSEAFTFYATKELNRCIQQTQNWFKENGDGCNAVIGISGGKDSTVTAALLAKVLGKDRVIGVMLPDGEQADIQDSKDVIEFLGINGIEFNIKGATGAMFTAFTNAGTIRKNNSLPHQTTQQARENLPPRIRMAALYLVAQSYNGMVMNTCNLSENWVGYSTIYGDTAGDFSPFANYTVQEVIEIGRTLGVPERFLVKPPSDGLCGKTDEDKLGFTYAVLDRYLRTGEIDDLEVKKRIDEMHKRNLFKHELMKCVINPLKVRAAA